MLARGYRPQSHCSHATAGPRPVPGRKHNSEKGGPEGPICEDLTCTMAAVAASGGRPDSSFEVLSYCAGKCLGSGGYNNVDAVHWTSNGAKNQQRH